MARWVVRYVLRVNAATDGQQGSKQSFRESLGVFWVADGFEDTRMAFGTTGAPSERPLRD